MLPDTGAFHLAFNEARIYGGMEYGMKLVFVLG
jgi:hypothetical protein